MSVVTRDVCYGPGDKWSCGALEFEADTPLGVLTYESVLPGPRHSEDSFEVTMTLGGVNLEDCVTYPEFEAPGKPGRWADEFAEGAEEEVQSTVSAWFESYKNELAAYLAEVESYKNELAACLAKNRATTN
jgi:hypothetical protein